MKPFFKQERKLISGCKANERQAQEALYKMFYEEMLRVGMRYLKSDELAEEALNTAFFKVFQHIGTFDQQKGELGAWIRTIMVRSCIDLRRKEAKFNEAFHQEEIAEVFMAPSVLDTLYAEDLLKAIRQLPAATQFVFNLSVLEGYSHKEIAEQMSIGESTSRWHLSEAKKQLRTMLQATAEVSDQPTENKQTT